MARHFLTGAELTAEEQLALVDRAIELKADRLSSRALEGKSVALIFDKPSMRTRVSFDVGIEELGGHAVPLLQGEVQMGHRESPRDIALVLSRMVHAIGVRTGPDEPLEELAAHASVPVINMLSRDHHPCQALADLVTLRERFGRLEGLKLAYFGDGNNMARSLLVAGRIAGMSRKAMEHDRVVASLRQQIGVDPVRLQQLTAGGRVGVVAHAHPDVRVKRVRAVGRLLRRHPGRLRKRELGR